MPHLRRFLARLYNVFRPAAADRELSRELESHLLLLEDAYKERGMSESEASRAARRAVGSLVQANELHREARSFQFLEDFRRDATLAFRMMRQRPGFTIVAIVTLTLGIGANVAIFTVVNGVLLNRLPFPNADRVIWMNGESTTTRAASISPRDFVEYRRSNRTLSNIAGVSSFIFSSGWVLNGHAVSLRGAFVTAGFFEVLGTAPFRGRLITREDENAREPTSAVLSYHAWKDAVAADPTIIGRRATIDGLPVTIVGVMPPGFDFPVGADAWVALPMAEAGPNRFFEVLGLLRPDIEIGAARSELKTIAAGIAAHYHDPNANGWTVFVRPMQEAIVGTSRPLLELLFGAVGLVLLIACVNIANLLLAHHTGRVREFALRRAVGATGRRLIRQLLTESLILSAIAATVAIPLAFWIVEGVRHFGVETLPRIAEVRIDGHVVLFSAALAVLTALIYGLVPCCVVSLDSRRVDLIERTRLGTTRHRRRISAALIVGETSLALCLLIAAALVVQSAWHTLNENPGFSPDRVVTTSISLPASQSVPYTALLDRVLERVRAVPGVQAAGGISELPLKGRGNDTYFTVVEHPASSTVEKIDADWRMTSDGYFAAMGIPLERGRQFGREDRLDSPGVVIIDRTLADRYFPGEDPIGKHLSIWEGPGDHYNQREIVGVVEGVRHASLRLPSRPTMYVPYSQYPRSEVNIVIRSAIGIDEITAATRRIMTEEDPTVAVPSFETMTDVVSHSAATDRLIAWLFAAFAMIGLSLAAAGVYGVFSRIVEQEFRDAGIRLALGASARRVAATIVGRGLGVAAIGLGIGATLAFALVHLLQSHLYAIGPHDAATYAGSALVLGAVALIACAIPARRIARLDPAMTLRYE